MTTTFPWAPGAMLVSIALACALASLLHQEKKWYRRKRPAPPVTWAGMSVLLVLLSACSGISSTNGDAPSTVTPLALTQTPQAKAIALTPTTSPTDWTTYHANNQRTGYIPDTPDPHH